jgi:hypothetical protein
MKSKICTTIDQCKKFLDLGIDINTADLTVTNYPLQDGSRFDFICCKLPNDTFPSITDGKSEKIPAWSLVALLDVLQKTAYFIDEDANVVLCSYKTAEWNLGINNSDLEFITKTNPVDACYEMIIKLHEQKLL